MGRWVGDFFDSSAIADAAGGLMYILRSAASGTASRGGDEGCAVAGVGALPAAPKRPVAPMLR